MDKADSEAEDAVLKKTVEELEADVICGKFELQLAGTQNSSCTAIYKSGHPTRTPFCIDSFPAFFYFQRAYGE